jgi:hypothetical protein
MYLLTINIKTQKTSLEKLQIYFVSTFFKQIHLLIHINLLLIYIIYGDRTIIGFVGLVVNLLNKLTDGAMVSVRHGLLNLNCAALITAVTKLGFSMEQLIPLTSKNSPLTNSICKRNRKEKCNLN